MIITSLARYPTRSDDQCASVNAMSVCLLVSKDNVNFFSPCRWTYLYRNLILYSLILIGPLKPCVYRYTVKNILIGCHRQTNLHSTCLEPKKCHEEFTDGLLQKVLSGSILILGGIKNRPFFVIPFQAKLLFNVNGNTAVNMFRLHRKLNATF